MANEKAMALHVLDRHKMKSIHTFMNGLVMVNGYLQILYLYIESV